MPAQSLELPPIKADLVTGVDVGGSKIDILDSYAPVVTRLRTRDFKSMHHLLGVYFHERGARPESIVAVMAGPRDGETGEITLTNKDEEIDWPGFNPVMASQEYGISVRTANDLKGTMAGILLGGIAMNNLKEGTAVRTGNKLTGSVGTGFGVGAAIWDDRSERFVIMESEGGHIDFKPETNWERGYLNLLDRKYPHASAELALAGKFGIDDLVDYFLGEHESPGLRDAIARARENNGYVSDVLLDFIAQGPGIDHEVAKAILGTMGAMVGSVMRNLAVTTTSKGGVYLAGGVAEKLGSYWADETDFTKRFVRPGAVHAKWLDEIPIRLVTDKHVTVKGAFALALGIKG